MELSHGHAITFWEKYYYVWKGLKYIFHCEELKAIIGNKYIAHISGANTLMLS